MEKEVIWKAKKLDNFKKGHCAVAGAYWRQLSNVSTNHPYVTVQQLDQLFDDRLKAASQQLKHVSLPSICTSLAPKLTAIMEKNTPFWQELMKGVKKVKFLKLLTNEVDV